MTDHWPLLICVRTMLNRASNQMKRAKKNHRKHDMAMIDEEKKIPIASAIQSHVLLEIASCGICFTHPSGYISFAMANDLHLAAFSDSIFYSWCFFFLKLDTSFATLWRWTSPSMTYFQPDIKSDNVFWIGISLLETFVVRWSKWIL